MTRSALPPAAAVFLDRDGTLIEEVGYLRTPEEVTLFPWSIDAVRALNRAGLPVVVITNQSGIARGLLTEVMRRGGPPSPFVAARSRRRAHRRVLLLSAPSRRQRERVCAKLRLPQARLAP